MRSEPKVPQMKNPSSKTQFFPINSKELKDFSLVSLYVGTPAYLIARSRFSSLFFHEFLGHYCLGILPTLKIPLRNITFRIRTPTILDVITGPLKDRRLNIFKILRVSHSTSIEYPSSYGYQYRYPDMCPKNWHLISAYISITGVIPEFMFYTILCTYFGSKVRDRFGDIYSTNFNATHFSAGIFLGGITRLLNSFLYYYTTSWLGNINELAKAARSGHDFAQACFNLYYYNRLNPTASLRFIGISYLMVVSMAMLCGTKLYETTTNRQNSIPGQKVSAPGMWEMKEKNSNVPVTHYSPAYDLSVP